MKMNRGNHFLQIVMPEQVDMPLGTCGISLDGVIGNQWPVRKVQLDFSGMKTIVGFPHLSGQP